MFLFYEKCRQHFSWLFEVYSVRTGYEMLENTDLKLSVFQHFLYLFHIKSGGIYMRQDIRQELRKYQMDKIKSNFTELGCQLGCDPRTAKKHYYLKEDGYENKRKRRKSKLDPYRNIIDEKVKNSYSATSIFYFIKEIGYTGGISILHDYCHQIKVKKQITPVVRIQTVPGQSAQVDWKEDLVLHTRKGTPIKFSVFLYVLGYSRKKYLNFVFDRKQDTLFSSLVGAFEFMNGVSKEIVFDNMKTAVDHARSFFTKVVWNEMSRAV